MARLIRLPHSFSPLLISINNFLPRFYIDSAIRANYFFLMLGEFYEIYMHSIF